MTNAATANIVEMPGAAGAKAPKARPEQKRTRGVYERVKGSGVWWVRWCDGKGTEHREKAGSWAAARDLHTIRRAAVLEGRKLPHTLRRPEVTFKQIAEDAVADIERRYRRPADDAARLRVCIVWFGNREAASLTPGEIEAKLSTAAAENEWAASTINHHRSVMSLAFKLAKRDKKVEANPVRDVAHRREHNNRVRSLSGDEERRLRAVIRRDYPAHEAEFDFALLTGLRQGTQYSLTWGMVDFDARLLRIPETKNGEPLVLPLHADAVRILRRLCASSTGQGRVFLSSETGKPFGYGPKHWFTVAVRKAGIENFRWHDLRHSFATRLREKGVPLEDIADLLGHKGLAMTRRYAHTSLERLQQAVSRLGKGRSTGTRTGTDEFRAQHGQAAGQV